MSVEDGGFAAALVTIGITCFREGDWLLECWESVLAQTDPRWTAVMVLDGGGDAHTRAVFEAIEHPKLCKHAMPENVGPYPVRNKAFELTETPYHFYLDGDDRLPPWAIRDVLSTFAAHPEAGFVYGDYELFGARSEIKHWRPDPTWDDFVPAQPIPGPCAYKKEVWEVLGGYPEELARGNGDYDLLIGAVERGYAGRHTGGVLYRHRVGHERRVSGSYERGYFATHELMVRRHPRFFADERRRRGFLAVGYRRSIRAALLAGDFAGAMSLARRALEAGVGGERELWRGLAGAGSRAALRAARSALVPPRFRRD